MNNTLGKIYGWWFIFANWPVIVIVGIGTLFAIWVGIDTNPSTIDNYRAASLQPFDTGQTLSAARSAAAAERLEMFRFPALDRPPFRAYLCIAAERTGFAYVLEFKDPELKDVWYGIRCWRITRWEVRDGYLAAPDGEASNPYYERHRPLDWSDTPVHSARHYSDYELRVPLDSLH